MVLNVCVPPLEDQERQSRLDQVLSCGLACREVRVVRRAEELELRPGGRLLFALALDGAGQNSEYQRMLARLRLEPGLLEGCTGGLIVDGPGELYTKSTAAELALAMNSAGCALVGRPLVEATGSLSNFRIQAKNLSTDLMGAYQEAVRELAERLLTFTFPGRERPRLLALHASSHHTSNTMALWALVQSRLSPRWEAEEVGLRNGTLSDCSGCPYTMCLHFGERGGCFYGGVMQEAVYPAVRRADALILMCPNYNDALSANLSAFINRLTALFRQTRFYEKAVFALVVSGYSGSDTVARQLISALNMNKSFYLPPRFALMETANAPGEALASRGIEWGLAGFFQVMVDTCAVLNIKKPAAVCRGLFLTRCSGDVVGVAALPHGWDLGGLHDPGLVEAGKGHGLIGRQPQGEGQLDQAGQENCRPREGEARGHEELSQVGTGLHQGGEHGKGEDQGDS